LAGVDADHTDAGRSDFGSEGVGQSFEAVFDGGVLGDVGARDDAGRGIDEDDLAGALLEVREEPLREQVWGAEVDAVLDVEFFDGGGFERGLEIGGGAVDENVDVAGFAGDSAGQVPDLLIFGEITGHQARDAGQIFLNGGERLAIAGQQADDRAALGKRERDGLADAAAGAGYESDLFVEFVVHEPVKMENFAKSGIQQTMSMVSVQVWDATGNKRQEVEMPDDAPVNRLIAVLLQKMNFPQYAPDGQPLSYKIHHRASGKQLLDGQTLGEVGVKSGDILRLQPEITAG
jgi:WXG100 protein secretion system (Wss), protein YukD